MKHFFISYELESIKLMKVSEQLLSKSYCINMCVSTNSNNKFLIYKLLQLNNVLDTIPNKNMIMSKFISFVFHSNVSYISKSYHKY